MRWISALTKRGGGKTKLFHRSNDRAVAKQLAAPFPGSPGFMALAIRFEGLVRNKTMRDYAELARLGRVTRARMTQIMKLLDLAPDIQEKILFLPGTSNLSERTLRPVVNRVDWGEQRRLFHQITNLLEKPRDSA
jgi:hypothetical protein